MKTWIIYIIEKKKKKIKTNEKKIFMTSTKTKTKIEFNLKKQLNFSIKNISKKCDIIIHEKQLNLINITREFSTTINVSRQRFVLMIDSSAKKKSHFWNKLIKKNSLLNNIKANYSMKWCEMMRDREYFFFENLFSIKSLKIYYETRFNTSFMKFTNWFQKNT